MYRIDLMKFGLLKRPENHQINLAGIQPYHEATVKQRRRDYRDCRKQVALPLADDGVPGRLPRRNFPPGWCSSPAGRRSQEDAVAGQVRTTVKDRTED